MRRTYFVAAILPLIALPVKSFPQFSFGDIFNEILKPRPEGGNSLCTGVKARASSCGETQRPIDLTPIINTGIKIITQWSQWNRWGVCSRSCGGGTRRRTRTCPAGVGCPGGSGGSSQTSSCNSGRCPVTSRWTSWSAWSQCSASCGGGIHRRSRTCSGGRNCFGQSQQSQSCNTNNCPIISRWSGWSSWSFCSRTCGGGTQRRSRTCSGGSGCSGGSVQNQDCNQNNCVSPEVNSLWSGWSSWSLCSRTCGGGTQRRSRTCSGRSECSGGSVQNQDCNQNNCVSAGVISRWSGWSSWSLCSRTCGGGTQSRSRTCSGGSGCSGGSVQNQACNQNNCVSPQEEDRGPTTFEEFLSLFGISYPTLEEFEERLKIFLENLGKILAHNELYDRGESTYYMRVNEHTDLTEDEFRERFGAIGTFDARVAAQEAKLEEPVIQGVGPSAGFSSTLSKRSAPTVETFQLSSPPSGVDWMARGATTPVRNQGRCNSCAAQATASVIESCLWRVTGELPPLISVQQLVDCNNEKIVANETSLRRKNFGCRSGWPDVHLNYSVWDQGGRIDLEQSYPLEPLRKASECQSFRGSNQWKLKARISDYSYEFFSNEEDLKKYVGLMGPSVSNIDVDPEEFRFYGGGLFYNETQCVNNEDEAVPEVCMESSRIRRGYTCLKRGGTNCAELLPKRCDRFFKRHPKLIPHSIAVVGYGVDRRSRPFWKLKNSWGTSWGEQGYMKMLRGRGHCGIGSYITAPTCLKDEGPNCRTTSVNENGGRKNAACVFPFIHKEVKYSQCAFHDTLKDYWCSTKVDASGTHVSGEQEWGICGPQCPVSQLSGPTCRTTDVNENGGKTNAACIFPFIHRGVKYSQCAFHDTLKVFWCSTKVDASGTHVSGEQEWGICGPQCPVSQLAGEEASSAGCVTVGGPDPGAACIFPFIFKGKEYKECTVMDAEDGLAWCSTKVDEEGVHVGGQGKWGHCSDNCATQTSSGDSSCPSSTVCESASSCDWYNERVRQINGLKKESPQYVSILSQLKQNVCNKEEKKICCP